MRSWKGKLVLALRQRGRAQPAVASNFDYVCHEQDPLTRFCEGVHPPSRERRCACVDRGKQRAPKAFVETTTRTGGVANSGQPACCNTRRVACEIHTKAHNRIQRVSALGRTLRLSAYAFALRAHVCIARNHAECRSTGRPSARTLPHQRKNPPAGNFC